MKVFDILDNRCHHEYPEYQSIEDTVGKFASNIVFVEAPDWVWEGYGYDATKTGDARFIRPELPEGWEYDENNNPWNPESFRIAERKSLHESTTNDTMEALRKIRDGDQTHDWGLWLAMLDQYNADVSATVNQESYPNRVVYPDYPTKPWMQ